MLRANYERKALSVFAEKLLRLIEKLIAPMNIFVAPSGSSFNQNKKGRPTLRLPLIDKMRACALVVGRDRDTVDKTFERRVFESLRCGDGLIGQLAGVSIARLREGLRLP
jgi:hypothetical protein